MHARAEEHPGNRHLYQGGEVHEHPEDHACQVALGYTSAEIAEKLSLSAKTVETYRARGMEKLGLRNRAGLVPFAMSKGIISAE